MTASTKRTVTVTKKTTTKSRKSQENGSKRENI